jgi:hypothetical protein
VLQSPMAEDDAPRATTVLEGGHGLPFLDGNASPMSLRSCCQSVASTFSTSPYYTGIFGFRKAGDLGFEPRLTDPESVVLPLHQSPCDLSGMSYVDFSRSSFYDAANYATTCAALRPDERNFQSG